MLHLILFIHYFLFKHIFLMYMYISVQKEKLKWGKSAEKWNSIMVVTIKVIVTITKLTKKLLCINYFKKYIYSASNFIFFFPHFLNFYIHTHPFIHTCKQAHKPPHINVNTNPLQKKKKKITTLQIETAGELKQGLRHIPTVRLVL